MNMLRQERPTLKMLQIHATREYRTGKKVELSRSARCNKPDLHLESM